MKRTALHIIRTSVLLLLATVLVGCSYLSVRHLERTPWAVGTPSRVALQFWRFEYAVQPVADGYVIRGRAVPREAIPERASWIREMWLATYLADERGRVLAESGQSVPSQPLTPQGVEFSFMLDTDVPADGSRFLTFGYKMTASQGPDSKTDAQPDGPVFFASESAVTRH